MMLRQQFGINNHSDIPFLDCVDGSPRLYCLSGSNSHLLTLGDILIAIIGPLIHPVARSLVR